MHIFRRLLLGSFLCSSLAPVAAFAEPVGVPYEQDFVLTAYYSPLPDQCCYVKGSYDADRILNGNGTHGADGTAVYPGMLAAPPSYAFGTRIVLPGLGTMTVHDRGGAIQEWEDSHRLDVWAGAGEEGLARALEFGVQRIRGTVYPPGTQMPPESISLEKLPAPENRLKPYIVAEVTIADLHPAMGARGLSVSLLQQQLKDLGYFNHDVTGMFGDVTKQSLVAFNTAMKISDEPSDTLSEKTAAYLEAAQQLKDASASPVAFVTRDSSVAEIKTAQRTMRYLGYYRGRTDGQYSSVLFNAILAYQKDHQLVGDAASPGAGNIGPMTKGKLDEELQRRRIARVAKQILVMNEIRDALDDQDKLVDATMQQGANGIAVRLLQQLLVRKGFFPADSVNGNFGPLTAKAVLDYQLKTELLKSASDKGAGTVGPVTLKMLRQEQVKAAYSVVRGYGWEAL